MAQTLVTDLFILERVDQTTYQNIIKKAAIAKAFQLLSTLVNVKNRADEKRRTYCRRITTSGIPNKDDFAWSVFNHVRTANQTLDDTDILERQPDGTTPGFEKLKTAASFSIDDFAGIVSGDESAPVQNTDAPDLKNGTVIPTADMIDKVGQLYYDTAKDGLYIAKASIWTKIA